jgi:SAM-dependent methyltransferase
VSRGQTLYKENGFGDRVVSYREIGFDDTTSNGSHDAVFWANPLHHMPDVQKAAEWSRRVLRNGGGFCMDEYVGPTRFQWTDRQMEEAKKIVRSIPRCFRVLLAEPFGEIRSEARKPTIAGMIVMDPSEAGDSGSICKSLGEFFSDAVIGDFGGIGFFLAMHDFLPNLDGEKQAEILWLLMLADELCIDLGESLYAAAIASK